MTSSGRVLAVERLGLSVFNYMFRLQIICRRQSGVVENPIPTADTTKLDSFVTSGQAV